MLDRLIDTHNLRVGLRAYQTGKAVAGVAANAAALVRIFLVEHDPDRDVEGLQSRTREIVGQLLNARLMTDGGPGIGSVGRWFGRIFCGFRAPDTDSRPGYSTAPDRHN